MFAGSWRLSTAMVAAMAMLQRRGERGLVRIVHVHHGQLPFPELERF